MYQEFPKGLSKGDDWVVAMNASEEAAAREQGYTFAHDEPTTPVEPKKRPGRPPKAKE